MARSFVVSVLRQSPIRWALAAVGLASPSIALAAGGTCPVSPTNWDAANCNAICSTTATTFTCDVSAAGGSSIVTIVEDFGTSAAMFEAWGDSNGTPFCCPSNGDYSPIYVEIIGSSYADTLTFTWAAGTANLLSPGAYAVTGTITAGDGADTLKGSYTFAATYLEYLYGEGDNDTINGNPGDDNCFGGAGDDTLFGGNDADYIEGNTGDDTLHGGLGIDEMYGGPAHDIMTGGDGDDVMYGDDGVDFMSGGNGDDYLHGGEAADIMCGDNEGASGDDLHDGDTTGGAVVDQIWGANAVDLITCLSTTTLIDVYSATSGCGSSYLSTRPSQCS